MKKFLLGILAVALVSIMAGNGYTASKSSKYGGVLKVFGNPAPTSLFLPKQATVVGAKQAASIVCESLGKYDKDYVTQPNLAKEIKLDPQALTIIITLPEGIKFSDGSELTSEDVKWNLEEWAKAGFAKNMGEPAITTPNKYTCVIKMSYWVNTAVNFIGEISIMSKQAFEKNGGEKWAATHLIGTGPFVLTKYIESARMIFEKNKNYHKKGLPYLDAIELIFIKDTAASLAAFRAGDFDTYQPNSFNGSKLLAEAQTLNISRIDKSPAIGSQSRCVFFNSLDKKSVFHDVRVRQAFLYAIDRKTLAKALTGGFGRKIDQFANLGLWGYNKNVVGYNYNPKKAKQLLADAGYPNGFECTIISPPSIAPDCVAMQAYLGKIGIKMNIEKKEWPVIYEAYVKGWPDLLYGAAPTEPDTSIMLAKMFVTGGDFSGSSLKPADVVEQVKMAMSAKTDQEKRAAVLKVQKLVTDKYALTCHIFSSPTLMFAKNYVKDSNMAQVSRYQWTPELCWIKK
jgi:peptide/nickel transport system substrate-binding protein